MAEQAVYFNPWDLQFCANPYPHYPALLTGPPALRDHERFSNIEPAPVAVGGTEVASGTMAFIVLAAAANRDPAQFPNPERFDITRAPNAHVAFGEGIHFRIGAPLARLEGSIAIGEMLGRFPKLRMKDPAASVQYKGSYFLRGLAALPMALE